MSSTAYDRGVILLGQGRFDLAVREFRRELALDPDNARAHACLSLCLGRGDQDAEALREAQEAVRLDPGYPFCHYVHGQALHALGREDEAEAAAIEAIRLDPTDADYPGLLASIAISRRRFAEAIAAAERGLALDPENATCANLRALALVQLGRKDEAVRALGSALADDPENALTHANQGWAYLHQADHLKAAEHFREALRLDPDLEWARVGIVEALKARSPIYRQMLRFFLWMGRLGPTARWAVILGFIFGRQALASLSEAAPALRPFIVPILVLAFGFLLMTWIASPLFNLTLRTSRFGRLALSREQRVESNWVGGSFLAAAALGEVYLATGSPFAFVGMAYFGLLLLPLAVTFNLPPGGSRRIAVAYTAALALAGLGVLIPGAPIATLVQAFVAGTILSTWLPALIGGRR
ncbi:tetratricopeptide repeat protein [Tundrisphaera sp. TA3]|uniref:tetratricopeptide repeat protein n=1 Tax=Tundrisphaera sp. TA3 TaxID=3435775 RepID=UPI003EB8373B